MKKLLFLIVIGASTMIVLALAAYFELGPFQPEKEVRLMLIIMSRLETVQYKAGLSWSFDQADRTTSVLATGQLNFTHPYSLEHGTNFRVVNLNREGESSDTAGEVLAINEDTFIKFDQAGPVIDGVTIPQADTWIRFDNPFGLSIKRAFLPSAKEDMKTIRAWSPESLPLLRALVAQADVLHITFDNETEEINNLNTRVFNARFDPEAVRVFLLEVIRRREGREPNNVERLEVESLAAHLEPMYLRLWIGIKDHRLYRLHTTGVIKEERDRRSLDIKIEFSDFNADFLVSTPKQFQNFSDLSYQQQNLPSSLNVLLGEHPNTRSLATDDMNSLPLAKGDQVEQEADTDHDGVSDGDEVLNGRNPKGQGSLFGFGLGN